jgi:Bacterial Ig domain/FG-GAP repeat
MKIIYTLLAMLLLTFSAFSQKNNVAGKLQNGKLNTSDENWLNKAQAFIKESGYHFKQKENPVSFYAANTAQHVGFAISPLGYSISPVITSQTKATANWQQSLSFAAISKGNNKMVADDHYTISQNKSVLQFNYANFTIEYINNEKGLRQNFIIAKKPTGNEDLELLLKTGGDLAATVVNNAVQFKNSKGAVKLFYTDLNVWDANNQVIKASMEMRDDNMLAIVVKDQNATYPLTIDPLNKTPEWTTSAEALLPALVGQLAVDAAYGFTLAGVGDVNGDGFDDVAIGAPAAADVISGTGNLAAVGAVFVYYGSLNGLPTTPSAVLQPTTVIAGALFGYSIAGGDINNDGKNDIIVGAPLDRVTISIGGGNTASGTVGKVYAFDGASLATVTNPLLSLQLDGSGILENGLNLSVNALFGFSVGVTEDLNNDNKRDIIVGSPTYAGVKVDIFNNHTLDVQSGGAFVFLSSGATHTLVKLNPMTTGILGLPILEQNINGLLFGYSVDGAGDYNSDGKNDVVVTAPAGVNLSSLGAILNNKLLQGSATVYYGITGNIDTDPGATLVATSGGLLTNITGAIGNIANMFGVSVKGVKNSSGARNGNVIVGAPLGGALMNILTLQLKTGTVSVFKKKATSPSGNVIPNQILASPRNNNTVLELIQSNLLFGYALDNTLDINCDGNTDIIVGEPASSGLQLLNTSIAGGAAYVYLGKADGTYDSLPFWTFTATEDAFLGINATSLIGYSVAGVGRVRGNGFGNKVLVGTPSRTLDFGAGLLNLGATLANIFSLTSGDNGVGKSFVFDLLSPCIGTQNTNPDINSSFVNVSTAGNANTNDNVPAGSTYGTPVLVSGPSGSTTTINMNSNGTYTFVTNKAGVYIYDVPVCMPSQPSPCPTTRLVVTVLEPTINNNPPVADVDIATTKLNTPVTIKTLANDAAGNVTTSLSAASVTITGAALHGTTSVNAATGDITYTPANNYVGSDTLTYQVCDNQSASQCASAKQIVTTLPAASSNTTTATDDYLIAQVNTITIGNVKTNDIDAEGNAQTVAPQTANVPGKGTLILLADGSYTFTPQTGFTGPVSFVYSTCDNGTPSSCAAATLHLLVRPELPYSNPDFNSTFINTSLPGNVSTNDKVPSGTAYGTAVAISSPSGSAATITVNSDGSYTFKSDIAGVYVYDVPTCYPVVSTPCPVARLTITVLDGTVTNNPPVANVDIASTKINTAVTVKTLANDAASYSSNALLPSTVVITVAPLHGTTSINPANGDITYTPAAGYVGTDTLTYQVCDNQFPSKCATAKQVITVLSATAANRTTAADDYVITRINTAANGNVKTNDTDAEGNTQTVTAQTTNYSGRGVLQLNTDGSYTFTPDTGFTGPADFTYTTCDNGTLQACATATLHVLIQPTFGLPDLTPTIFNDSTNLVKGTTRDNAIRIKNIGSGPTTAPIIFTIPKMLPSFEITIDPNATSMNVAGGTAVTNASWTIVEQTNRYVFTSKPGLVLQVGDSNFVGVKVKAVGMKSSTGNLSVQIILGTGGGETPFNNNNHNNTYIIY